MQRPVTFVRTTDDAIGGENGRGSQHLCALVVAVVTLPAKGSAGSGPGGPQT